jgi:Nucleotidyl transferase AbiEii toxin, Type IV TA system/Type I restriction modification DNA specificity domain
MNRRQPRDVAASVRARLLARSRETSQDFQFLLQRYASERFLYRLSASPYRRRFVLKGAMLFALWGGSLYRATRDLDFAGYGSSETDAVIAAVRDICALPFRHRVAWRNPSALASATPKANSIDKVRAGRTPQQLPEGLPFIRATNVSNGRILTGEMQFVDPDDVPSSRNPVLRSGDIVVVRSGAYTGDSAIIPPEYDGAIAGYDMVARPRRAAAPSFLAWALLSRYVLQAQMELESLRAAQPHLNAEELGAVVILLPREQEQFAIAEFIDKRTTEIEALVTTIRGAIERLKEFRTALISSAVTGKIDVRGEIA